jgi:hemoglobin
MTSQVQSARAPALGPGVAVGVDEAMIRDVVHAFYAKVRGDEVLGPVFARVPDAEWGAHLAKLCDFWSSVLLATRRYQGRPMPAHVAIPEISPPHFARWLELFRATAREVCPPEAAALFVARAEMIAQSLQLGIAASRGELPPLHAGTPG